MRSGLAGVNDVDCLPNHCELAIVGAGPAGLAAASLGADLGIDVLLLDEQEEPGGQIYRGVANRFASTTDARSAEDMRGEALIASFWRSGARYVAGALVWSIESANAHHEIYLSVGGRSRQIVARQLVLGTGAYERAFPIPGWTLPGVMTAGAAQILLKKAALIPSGKIVLAGCGPLLYRVAQQLVHAGAEISALLDTLNWTRLGYALPFAVGFLRSRHHAEGAKLLRDVHERIDVIHGVKRLAALGDDRLDAVQYTLGASARTLSADLLLLHQGIMPSVNLSMSLGCRHVWDPLQHCFRPHVDRWGATDRRAVFIAGDGAGIVGAFAAEEQGRLAALAAAHALGRIDAARRDELARLPRRALKHALRGRRFIDALYRPAAQFRMPDRDTVVCRCEEVTAVQIIDAVRGGCTGPNQAKAFLRCGMGPCQGRLCGTTVTELVARETCSSPAKVGHFRMRFPVKPVTLGELAALAKASAEASTAGE